MPQDKPVIIFSELSNLFFHLTSTVNGVAPTCPEQTVKLEAHQYTYLRYSYSLRPFAVDVLKELNRYFSMMVYSAGSDYNADALAQILENQAKMRLFPYAMGKKFL